MAQVLDVGEYRETDQSSGTKNRVVQDKLAMNPSGLCFNEDSETLHYTQQGCHKIPEILITLYGTKIQTLDLSFNELVTLKGVERFPLLRELILDNNHLSDNIIIPYLPYLHTLTVNKNKLTDLQLFITKIKQNLPALTYLSILGNPACPDQLTDSTNDDEDYQRYRYYVLHHIPNLEFLDSRRVQTWEVKEAVRRGELMLVVRPKPNEQEEDNSRTDTALALQYTPLPKNIRGPNDQKSAYGKCKYRYSGKHSEGNRFISNNDL